MTGRDPGPTPCSARGAPGGVGVPAAGHYREIFNSDSEYYGGSNVGNGDLEAERAPWMGHPFSLALTLPPLGGLVLRRDA